MAAWRRLRELKDHAKLKSWLYAIARNLISTAFRQQTRNPLASADPLDEALESGAEFCAPSEAAVSKEEEAILWQVLSGMPEIYRQPMVLFYRQEESMESVAEILGISEEAVRQRLSRGRAMLNERVAKVVEMGLRRSGPSKAFGLAVLAALPVASAKAGTFGAATAAAKGSGLLPGAGLLATIGSIASSVASVLGGLIALWGRVRNVRSPRERVYARRTVWGLLAFTLGFLTAYQVFFSLGVIRLSTQPRDVITCTLFWLAFLGPLFFFSIRRSRRQRQIHLEESVDNAASKWGLWNLDPSRPGFGAATYGTLSSLVFGSCSWLVVAALHVKDYAALALIGTLAVAGWLRGGAAIMRRPEKSPSIVSALWWSLALVNLVALNVRWDTWFRGAPLLQLPSHPAPWTVDYLLLVFFATAQAAWWIRRYFMNLPDARRATRIAVGAYLALMASLSVVLAVIR